MSHDEAWVAFFTATVCVQFTFRNRRQFLSLDVDASRGCNIRAAKCRGLHLYNDILFMLHCLPSVASSTFTFGSLIHIIDNDHGKAYTLALAHPGQRP